jgi:hypothetical protein
MIEEAFPGRFVALSRDETSDGFWRRVGWTEHDHVEAADAYRYYARSSAVLS